MKLLYTLTTYPPAIGGAQLHQHLLAQHLQPRHPIQVVSHWDRNRTDWLLGTTLNAPATNRDYTIDNILVHRIGLSFTDKLQQLPFLPLYYPLMDVALPAIARPLQKHLIPYARQADLIHNVRIGREGISYAALQVARQRNIPFILTPAHHPRWVGWRYRAYNQIYRQADRLIALTTAEKNALIQLGVTADKISITGHGPILAPHPDPESFKIRHKITDPIILFLGQHYPYKGYQQLLQATTLVWQKVPDAQFAFIGPAVGNSEQYFQHHADPHIHRLGTVTLQEKTDAIAACSLLCVPSNQESFGGIYTEAWSMAKPAIGCPIPAVADVIAHNTDGLLVEQTPAAIADAICYLLLNPSEAQRMGEAGRQKVVEKYTWDKLALKTEEAYKQSLLN